MKTKVVAIKADRDPLRRIVMALESGLDVDVDELLQIELLFLLFLFQASGKSDLSRTFGEWCDKLSAYVASHFSDKCTRVDVVFDRYLPNSIKGGKQPRAEEGTARGSGGMWKAGIRGLVTGRGSLC